MDIVNKSKHNLNKHKMCICCGLILFLVSIYFKTNSFFLTVFFFNQLRKQGIFRFLGVQLKKLGLGFLGGLKKNWTPFPPFYSTLLTKHFIFLKTFLYAHQKLISNSLQLHLWICCLILNPLHHTRNWCKFLRIIYKWIIYYSPPGHSWSKLWFIQYVMHRGHIWQSHTNAKFCVSQIDFTEKIVI